MKTPYHPFWCDFCGEHAPFTIQGCEIDHLEGCRRRGEDAEEVYRKAVEYCKQGGGVIP